jgi:hypothetical protein
MLSANWQYSGRGIFNPPIKPETNPYGQNTQIEYYGVTIVLLCQSVRGATVAYRHYWA